jgi:hypothetical protein
MLASGLEVTLSDHLLFSCETLEHNESLIIVEYGERCRTRVGKAECPLRGNCNWARPLLAE